MNKLKLTTNPNSTFRTQGRSRPSLRGSRPFCLGRNLRQIPQSTIWVCCLATLISFGTVNSVSALTYSKDVDVKFTIQPSVSISLDSSTLKINDLSPGQSADSNIVTLTVDTNSDGGYIVGSTVGGTYNGKTFTTSNLQHDTNYDTTKALSYFQSLGTSTTVADLANLDAGKWGYAFKINSGNWSDYSGLPYNDGEASAELMDVSEKASNTIQFKIAAKAQDMQYSGEYNNVINFTAIVKDPPSDKTIADATYMQEVTACPDTLTTGQIYTIKDSRDEQSYNVAKLADGKCWMVENLNLAGNTALSADDTDVTSTYISGFTTQGNLTKSGDTIELPASSPASTSVSGYYTDDTMAYLTNSGSTTCASNTPCYSYYSWIAATLGGKQADGSTAQTSDGYNAAASICPKGWRLPTATTSNADPTSGTNYQTGDFYQMMVNYGLASGNRYENPDNAPKFIDNAGPDTTPDFLLTGVYGNGSFGDGGSRGYYTSATSNSSTNAYDGRFGNSYVNSANRSTRRSGLSVRCLFAE